jgi:hypothetical protein
MCRFAADHHHHSGAPAYQTAASSMVVWILIPLFVAWPRISGRIDPLWRKALLLALPLALLLVLVKYGFHAYGRYVDAAGDRSQVRPELCCFRIHWWPWRSWQAGLSLSLTAAMA